MSQLIRLVPSLLFLLAVVPVAHAERADRQKPVVITAEHNNGDDRNKIAIWEGRVTLTQGTLVILSDKLVGTQDAEGFQTGVATGGKDGLARFRQKKEGKDEYIEGEAERIEYDGRTDKIKFFGRAICRSGLNEAHGEYIEYDGYTELYSVDSANKAGQKDSGHLTTTVITPKPRPDAAASKPAGKQ
jgi:lipopolysaccharide export system protein LptA